MSPRRICCALAALVLLVGTSDAGLARSPRRHRVGHFPPATAPVPNGFGDLEARSAYASGVAFGLLNLGISGTATAVSPYAPAGFGFRQPGYYGPGYGTPGY